MCRSLQHGDFLVRQGKLAAQCRIAGFQQCDALRQRRGFPFDAALKKMAVLVQLSLHFLHAQHDVPEEQRGIGSPEIIRHFALRVFVMRNQVSACTAVKVANDLT